MKEFLYPVARKSSAGKRVSPELWEIQVSADVREKGNRGNEVKVVSTTSLNPDLALGL